MATSNGVRRLRGQVGGSRWEVALRPPSPVLRPLLRGDYTGCTERTGALNRRTEFPIPFVVMIIEFGPPIRISKVGHPRRVASHRGGFAGGLCDTVAVCEHDGFQQGIQVNLARIGARLLFGIPMYELRGQIVSVRDLLPARHRGLGERLRDRRLVRALRPPG